MFQVLWERNEWIIQRTVPLRELGNLRIEILMISFYISLIEADCKNKCLPRSNLTGSTWRCKFTGDKSGRLRVIVWLTIVSCGLQRIQVAAVRKVVLHSSRSRGQAHKAPKSRKQLQCQSVSSAFVVQRHLPTEKGKTVLLSNLHTRVRSFIIFFNLQV